MVQPLPSSLGIALLIAAAPTAALAEAYVPFPSQDNLRQVQLAALACARENSAASCDQARKLADPLLDHPRLPTGCKDHLWAIRQKAVPAAAGNSFARREAISQPAQLLLLACRSGEKAPEPAAAPPAGSGGGGLKFGGGR